MSAASFGERPRRAYEELASCPTPFGELVLRRRLVPGFGDEPIHEITVDGEMLMSGLLDASERALATLSIARARGSAIDVVVGGLGLGRTVEAALADERVARVDVVEIVADVVRWHERGLVPWGPSLLSDPRVRIHRADFFALFETHSAAANIPERPHVVLVDIDHRPDALLSPSHARFQSPASLRALAARLASGGVLGFWSAGPSQSAFASRLGAAFAEVTAHEIRVDNPMTDEEQIDTVYVASGGPLA